MTTFVDGPAKGQTLALRRAPLFLRVVCDGKGKWDALDQIGDSPADGERILGLTYLAHQPPSITRASGSQPLGGSATPAGTEAIRMW